MRLSVILNREGGTLRTLDLDAFEAKTRAVLEDNGHTVAITSVTGDKLMDALDSALAEPTPDAGETPPPLA